MDGCLPSLAVMTDFCFLNSSLQDALYNKSTLHVHNADDLRETKPESHLVILLRYAQDN